MPSSRSLLGGVVKRQRAVALNIVDAHGLTQQAAGGHGFSAGHGRRHRSRGRGHRATAGGDIHGIGRLDQRRAASTGGCRHRAGAARAPRLGDAALGNAGLQLRQAVVGIPPQIAAHGRDAVERILRFIQLALVIEGLGLVQQLFHLRNLVRLFLLDQRQLNFGAVLGIGRRAGIVHDGLELRRRRRQAVRVEILLGGIERGIGAHRLRQALHPSWSARSGQAGTLILRQLHAGRSRSGRGNRLPNNSFGQRARPAIERICRGRTILSQQRMGGIENTARPENRR